MLQFKKPTQLREHPTMQGYAGQVIVGMSLCIVMGKERASFQLFEPDDAVLCVMTIGRSPVVGWVLPRWMKDVG